jgi:hypothetical protein
MSAGAQEPREVAVDVLPPLPHDTARPISRVVETPTPPLSGLRTFYHPASGVVILGIDLLVFGPEMFVDMASGFLGLPLICLLTFLVTLPLVYLVQAKWGKDTKASAFGKAFLGAFLAGLPFSITGTVLGACVLALAGLPANPVEALKKIMGPQQGR